MIWHPPAPDFEGPRVPVQVSEVVRAMQGGYPTQRGTVPRVLSEEAYKEYSAQYGTSQSHERLLERAGFGVYELMVLLFQRIKRLEHQAVEVSTCFGICRTCHRGPGIAITAEGLCKGCHSEAHP